MYQSNRNPIHSLKNIFLGLFLLVVTSDCSMLPCHSCSQRSAEDSPSDHVNKYQLFQTHQPSIIWSPKINHKIKKTLIDFKDHKLLVNGLHYGDSVRNFSLNEKTAVQITVAMKELNCEEKDDFLQHPKTHLPISDKNGQKVPMTVFLCPDGGVIRVKPEGDPTSRFRPQPHASKSLRYPYNSQFESFDDEMVKVNNRGEAVPKWAQDLNPSLTMDPIVKKEIIEEWANDAHTDLKSNE